MATSHTSVYDIVTEGILAELKMGQVPWRTLPPANLITKKPYRGINVFLLALASYGSQFWLTYRQAQAPGGNVRKGEHGAKIVFWKFDKYETETPDGESERRKSAFLRYDTVFNLEQTEGLKALLALPAARPIRNWVRRDRSASIAPWHRTPPSGPLARNKSRLSPNARLIKTNA